MSLAQVSQSGDKLTVELPEAVVEALALKAGDQIQLDVAGGRSLCLSREDLRLEAIARLRARRRLLPAGYRFDREEATAR